MFCGNGGYKLNPYGVILHGNTSAPWSLHRVNLERMPIINSSAPDLCKWLWDHVDAQHSIHDLAVESYYYKMRPFGNKHSYVPSFPKESICALLYRCITRHLERKPPGGGRELPRVIALYDACAGGRSDTFLFLSAVRFDLGAHTVVGDAYVLTLGPHLPPHDVLLARFFVEDTIDCARLVGEDEVRAWKQLLPACAERCRTWAHTARCEYRRAGATVPLHTKMHAGDPLCSCGRGKDVEGMRRVREWRSLAPHVTRVALSPLFPVWDAEPFILERLKHMGLVNSKGKPRPDPIITPGCSVCKKQGMMKRCGGCKDKWYCSQKCQRADWKEHKAQCKRG